MAKSPFWLLKLAKSHGPMKVPWFHIESEKHISKNSTEAELEEQALLNRRLKAELLERSFGLWMGFLYVLPQFVQEVPGEKTVRI